MRHGSKFNGNSKRIYSISATFQLASFNLLMMGLSTFYVEYRNVFELNVVTTNVSIWKKYCISDMEYFYSNLLAAERYCLP
ncbi:hypothetical protein ALC57_15059 [Trachymyrmex cornetzi]|uniref:Uncharacterized protein n=1 Tax=Trachymyrmex cornetzi TaxID=471704 RepID=A0A195DIP8_9HYME|nr:hypothetical protein ALC57_15059 [Trachymyrmex cornetzi]